MWQRAVHNLLLELLELLGNWLVVPVELLGCGQMGWHDAKHHSQQQGWLMVKISAIFWGFGDYL